MRHKPGHGIAEHHPRHPEIHLGNLRGDLFGGTPTLISEPTGPMTVVMTAVIASLIAANPENGLAMAFTTLMMAGLFQILFGVLRLGRYVTLMPCIASGNCSTHW